MFQLTVTQCHSEVLPTPCLKVSVASTTMRENIPMMFVLRRLATCFYTEPHCSEILNCSCLLPAYTVPFSNQSLASTLVSFAPLSFCHVSGHILSHPMRHPTVCFLLSCPRAAKHAGEKSHSNADVCIKMFSNSSQGLNIANLAIQ